MLARLLGIRALATSSHCPRIGCCSALKALGLSPDLINEHIGWAKDSDTHTVYTRRIELQPFDAQFYFELLSAPARMALVQGGFRLL